MRNVLLTLALAISAQSAPTLAADHPRSIPESTSLTQLFSVMSEIAADGPSLSYFGWTEEKAHTPHVARCRPAGENDVEQYVRMALKDMDWTTPNQQQVIDQHLGTAMTDLREIVGMQPLNQCDWDVTEQMTLTKVTKFTNTVTGYEITLSLGYED